MNDFLPSADKDGQSSAAKGIIDKKRPLRFVLIQRVKTNPDFPWEVVSEDCFSDIVNQVTTKLTFEDKETMKCSAWADARKGQIALKSTSRSRIEPFRQAIRDWAPAMMTMTKTLMCGGTLHSKATSWTPLYRSIS